MFQMLSWMLLSIKNINFEPILIFSKSISIREDNTKIVRINRFVNLGARPKELSTNRTRKHPARTKLKKTENNTHQAKLSRVVHQEAKQVRTILDCWTKKEDITARV